MKSKILLCLRYTDAVRSLWGLRGVSCDLPTGTPRPGRLESQRWVTTVTGVGEDLEKLEMLCVINRFCLHNVADPHNGKGAGGMEETVPQNLRKERTPLAL